MSVKVSRPEGSNLLAPAGTFQAVCYGVWDLGTQKSMWDGVATPRHVVVIAWEISPRIEEEGDYKGKRYVVSNRYTASLNSKSNLYKDLVAWRGKGFTSAELGGFELEDVIGANCLLQVIHKDSADGSKTYANIGSLISLPEGTPKLTPEIPSDPPKWITDAQANQFSVNEVPETHYEKYDERNPHN